MSKDKKAFIRDLKSVYKAVTKEAAEMALDELGVKWGEKYPKAIESWRNKWHLLSKLLQVP